MEHAAQPKSTAKGRLAPCSVTFFILDFCSTHQDLCTLLDGLLQITMGSCTQQLAEIRSFALIYV
jgi:hypothetical protein